MATTVLFQAKMATVLHPAVVQYLVVQPALAVHPTQLVLQEA
jgi:hypothetical protein